MGFFTNKIEFRDDYVIPKGNIRDISENISEWLTMATQISTPEYKQPLCCYRTISGPNIKRLVKGHIIPHPIPSSATFDLRMALGWLGNRACCLLQLNLPLGTRFTIFDRVGHKDTELIIPPGDVIIRRKKRLRIRGKIRIVYICEFKPLTYVLKKK